MKFITQTLAMCAPPGFDSFTTGVGMVVVIGIFIVVGIIGYFCIRDAFRFGRKGLPWLGGTLTPAIFSAVGYFVAGPIGVVAGVPLLIAFGVGRRAAKRCTDKTHINE
jgi:hypothetical protein